MRMTGSFIFKYIYGPRLYRIHKTADREGRSYEPNGVEGYSDNIIRSLSLAWSLGVYTSPIIAAVLYRRGYVTFEGVYALTRLAGVICVVMVGTICLRGIGRIASSDYGQFLRALQAAQQNLSKESKAELAKYDSEFYAWPIDFRWNDPLVDKSKPRVEVERQPSNQGSFFASLRALPCEILSYIAVHTFGRRMMYPGTVKLLQAAHLCLFKGRARLIEEHNAMRHKLLTRDGNEIDSVFVDRRNSTIYANGNILVVCCEGNAGFYDTGVPFPDQEKNAVDVVMQFAIHRLGFAPENIIVYAWSIGAYCATWAAMNYPDIKGLVKPIVRRTIRGYLNLNNLEQLNRFGGPVLMYRRTRDEIISTQESAQIVSNRGNDLLIGFLKHRFPRLVTEETLWALRDWLSGDRGHQMVLWNEGGVDEDACMERLAAYIRENGQSFPMLIGDDLNVDVKIQLILFLARKHMVDFNSTHCTPLPSGLFQAPWDLIQAADPNGRGADGFCRVSADMCGPPPYGRCALKKACAGATTAERTPPLPRARM
ncbi:hypothetical protein MRX96_035512 [Rhipicephalus microplus]